MPVHRPLSLQRLTIGYAGSSRALVWHSAQPLPQKQAPARPTLSLGAIQAKLARTESPNTGPPMPASAAPGDDSNPSAPFASSQNVSGSLSSTSQPDQRLQGYGAATIRRVAQRKPDGQTRPEGTLSRARSTSGRTRVQEYKAEVNPNRPTPERDQVPEPMPPREESFTPTSRPSETTYAPAEEPRPELAANNSGEAANTETSVLPMNENDLSIERPEQNSAESPSDAEEEHSSTSTSESKTVSALSSSQSSAARTLETGAPAQTLIMRSSADHSSDFGAPPSLPENTIISRPFDTDEMDRSTPMAADRMRVAPEKGVQPRPDSTLQRKTGSISEETEATDTSATTGAAEEETKESEQDGLASGDDALTGAISVQREPSELVPNSPANSSLAGSDLPRHDRIGDTFMAEDREMPGDLRSQASSAREETEKSPSAPRLDSPRTIGEEIIQRFAKSKPATTRNVEPDLRNSPDYDFTPANRVLRKTGNITASPPPLAAGLIQSAPEELQAGSRDSRSYPTHPGSDESAATEGTLSDSAEPQTEWPEPSEPRGSTGKPEIVRKATYVPEMEIEKGSGRVSFVMRKRASPGPSPVDQKAEPGDISAPGQDAARPVMLPRSSSGMPVHSETRLEELGTVQRSSLAPRPTESDSAIRTRPGLNPAQQTFQPEGIGLGPQMIQHSPADEPPRQPSASASESAAPSSVSHSALPSAPTAAETAPSVDIDTMAREVYAILRRRLLVERERARGLGG